MTSDKGGLAFTFDLDFTCQPSEARKILALGEHLKAYEDIGTVEDFQKLVTDNYNLLNELCQKCGRYKEAHKGACNSCKWRAKE